MSTRIRKPLAPLFAPLRLWAKHFATPRALNDYATHVPILIGLARAREIRRVLEFGCGHYSTLTFLNRTAFPQLAQLHSIENDALWCEAINGRASGDERWTLQLVNGEIANSVSKLNLESFDLILIDDSKTSALRAATIRAVANNQPQHPWIVIHDFEVDEYQQAASAFRHRHRFKAYNPETGLLTNRSVDTRLLRRLIKEKARLLAPEDVAAWTTVL